MEDIFNAIAVAPVANLFIIGGLFFVAIAVLGKISGKIEPNARERVWAGGIGALLVFSGLGLHLAPSFGAKGPTVTAEPTADAVRVAQPAAPALQPVASAASPTAAPAALAAPTALSPTTAPQARPTPPVAQAAAPLPVGSWTRLGDLPRHVNALAVDPADGNVVYAGTGDAGSGTGVFRSADAGATWARTSTGLPEEDVKALAFGPGRPGTLLASAGDVVYGSAGGDWALLGDAGTFAFYRTLHPHPSDPKTIYMVARPGGLLRSRDGGVAWTALSGGLPGENNETYVMSLAIDPSSPDVLYAGTGGWVGHGSGVWKSTDGGATWAPANRGMIDYRISAVAVDPQNPQRVYAGGDAGELFVSDDAGQSWADLTATLPHPSDSHATVDAIAIDSANGRVYLLCHYVGLVVSGDAGGSWESLGVPPGVSSIMFTSLAVLPGAQPVVIAGTVAEGGWRYAP